jgi:hypothetical protein
MPLTICRLLAVFALLGLVLAPLARPAMAGTGMPDASAHHEMMNGMSMDDASAMPEDMPCCPEKAPMPDCGQHCLMAMCAATVLPTLPGSAWEFLPTLACGKLAARHDPALSGVPPTPPPRPPRA